jgi:gliding motility-associated-like protein
LRDFQLEIYNRWGKRVFSSNSINEGWNGRLNGEVCPQGVYIANLSWSGYSDQKIKRVSKNSRLTLLY